MCRFDPATRLLSTDNGIKERPVNVTPDQVRAEELYHICRELRAENAKLRVALADVIPLAGMANLTPESQAKLKRAKHVFDSLQ